MIRSAILNSLTKLGEYNNKDMSEDKLFRKEENVILKDGLRAATVACEALTEQNRILNKDVEKLKAKVRLLEEKVLNNLEERE